MQVIAEGAGRYRSVFSDYTAESWPQFDASAAAAGRYNMEATGGGGGRRGEKQSLGVNSELQQTSKQSSASQWRTLPCASSGAHTGALSQGWHISQDITQIPSSIMLDTASIKSSTPWWSKASTHATSSRCAHQHEWQAAHQRKGIAYASDELQSGDSFAARDPPEVTFSPSKLKVLVPKLWREGAYLVSVLLSLCPHLYLLSPA